MCDCFFNMSGILGAAFTSSQWSSPSPSLLLYWDLITNQLENPASQRCVFGSGRRCSTGPQTLASGFFYRASLHGCSMNSCAVSGTSLSGWEWASDKCSWGVGEIWKIQWDSVCKHGQVFFHRNHRCNCFVWFNVAFLKEGREAGQDANFIFFFFGHSWDFIRND